MIDCHNQYPPAKYLALHVSFRLRNLSLQLSFQEKTSKEEGSQIQLLGYVTFAFNSRISP